MKSMTYGVVPSFAEFSAHLDTARRDDEPVWDGKYEMLLVGSDVKQAEKALKKIARAKGTDRVSASAIEHFTGSGTFHSGKYGLRIHSKTALWHFIKALPVLTDSSDGDLASSIMETLGYEWV